MKALNEKAVAQVSGAGWKTSVGGQAANGVAGAAASWLLGKLG